MALSLFADEDGALAFNKTVYQANKANPWKFLETIDPNDAPGLMLTSPIPILTITAVYIIFVCLIGPAWMQSRDPYRLKSIIRFYNLIEVFLAGYLLHRVLDAVESPGSFLDCNKVFTFADQSGTKVYLMAQFILFVRLSEYFDTIFFTLRKKQNQVTFLHVFHHAFVPIYAYWILRTAPLRFNVYIIIINSAVHVIMYFYYFLATFQDRPQPGAKVSKKGQDSFIMQIVMFILKFKKYVTQLQILQFVSLALYTIYIYTRPNSCGVPGKYLWANFLLAAGFLSLFVHFYIRSYNQARAIKSQATRKAN